MKFKNFWKCWNTYVIRDNNAKIYTLTEEEILKMINQTKFKEHKNRKNIRLEVI